MSKNKVINKKILFAAVLCLACTTGIANAEEITNGKNVKIYDEVYENLNEQNIINYGSKWGINGHNSSGWIVDIENTNFLNNIQSTSDNGSIIKNCSSSMVLRNVVISGNKSLGDRPIVDVWQGRADESEDGDAPNHNAVITFINSEVTDNNNHMYFQKGSIANIIAQNSGETLFSDNGKGGIFKVISNTGSAVVNFNADNTSTITVNDSIVDTDGRTVMNINKSGLTYTGLQLDGSEYVEHTYDITETGGTYNFNDNIGVGTLNIFNGAKVNFGSYEHPNSGNSITTYGSLNVLNFSNDANGGLLNFINNHADNNNLGNVKLGSDIYVNIDLISSDLTNFSGDTFAINVASDYAGLKSAIDNAVSNPTYTYTLDSDITDITTTLGTMQGSGYKLTIDGSDDNYGISADGVKGVTVQGGQTLIIQNIGSFAPSITDGQVTDVTVNGSWNGFTSSNNGGIENKGILEITNSVFENNTAGWGAAVSNKGTNMTVSDSAFVENTAPINSSSKDDGGAAIFNNSHIDLIEDSIFKENIGRHGGAIFNKADADISKISGSSFLKNDTTTNTANNAGGGAIYNNGSIDELSNSYFAENTTAHFGGAIYNNGTITIKNTNFVNNSASVENGSSSEGGAIYNTKTATISAIDGGLFDGNSSDKNGGAIANYGTIGTITADFKNNKTKARGAAIYNSGTITSIKDSNFTNNSTSNSDSDGGGIYNAQNALIEEISGGKFEDNSALNEGAGISNFGTINLIENVVFNNNSTTGTSWGIIYNNKVGTIDKITGLTVTNNSGDALNSNGLINEVSNSTFSGNTGYGIAMDQQSHIVLVSGMTISDNVGGGIYLKNVNPKIDVVENSSITGNGFGIWTGTNMTLQSDGGTTTIKDNESNGENLGIYVGFYSSQSSSTTKPKLTLKQVNNGKTYMYDVIKGNDGYSVDIVGDNTGTLYLYNNIDNGKVTVTTSNIDTADGTLYDYTLKSLNTDSEASNWKIDVDLFGEAADTIATTTLAQTEVKYVHLKELNLIGGDLDDLADGESVTVQVLKTQTNLQLSLDSDLSGEQKLASVNIDPEHTRVDEMKVTTEWGDIYHEWIVDDKFRNTYGEWTLDQTTTANDSLTVVISKKIEGGEEHDQGAAGDTLRLVNEDTTIDSRNFNATVSGSTYTVTEDLGETQGTLTINGIEDSATETVDLARKSGFVLGDDAVALNFNDVTIEGNSTIATVTNQNAKIGLNNTILNGNIDSNVKYDLSIGGTTTINGTVNNSNATFDGTELKFNTNTFKNAELSAQAGTLNVQDGLYNNYNIGKLTSSDTVRYAIDMELSRSNQQTDSFTVGSGSSGIIYLTWSSVNVTEDMGDDESAIIQIIKAEGTTGPELRYDGSKVLNQAQEVMTSEYILAKEFGLYSKDTTNDSIMVRGIQDTFKAWANLQSDEHKEYTFTDSADYTVADTVNFDGNNNAEIINNGTVTNNGSLNNFTLTNNNIFTNNSTSLSVSGGTNSGTINGSGNLTNTGTFVNTGTISNNLSNSGTFTSSADNLGGTITNNGTLNLNGALAKAISGTGTTVVNSSLTLNNGASVEGTLDLNGGDITISQGSATEHNVGSLAGSGNLAIDYDGTNIDTIILANEPTNPVVITITALTTPANTTDFTQQVIFGGGENTSLVLSGDVINQYNKTEDVNQYAQVDLTTPVVKWNDKYGVEKWTETYQSEISVVSSSDTESLQDTIQYETTKIAETDHYWDPEADNLALINRYEGQGSEDRSFLFDDADNVFRSKEDAGSTSSGTFTILGQAQTIINDNGDEIRQASTIDFDSHKGFDIDNDDTTLILKDVNIQNAQYIAKSGNSTSVIDLDGVILDGSNGEGIVSAGTVNIKGESAIDDNISLTSTTSALNVDGSNNVNIGGELSGYGKLNIENGNVNFNQDAKISGLDTTISNVTINLGKESTLDNVNLTVNNEADLNVANEGIGALSFDNINLNGTLKMNIDADLANAQMDTITANSATIGPNGKIDVQKINLLSPTTQKQLDILFTDNSDIASVVNYTGEGQIAYSPIFKYNTSYSQKDDGKGYFSFVTAGNKYGDFNPSVMASSVTAIVTGYQNQIQALHDGFYHMDRYMKHSASYRLAAENQYKYASLSPVMNYDINNVPETSQAMWVLPYSTFERVNLKGGVKVDNIAYGMTLGGDTDMFDMKHGFKGVVSGFIGYNGNQMHYDGISMTQNGGFLGATLNAYKGNFFTGLTVSTGASTGGADTMYGHDDITLLTAGIANKTGYNFEFMEGKLILQPSLFLGYTWVNTFDYTNSAGVRINQDALNALQVAPGLKIIGNTKNGWQPYAGVDMVWNIFMGRNRVSANDVILPQLSERAYVQYGVGVQKTWADRFTGFLQSMVRNGGRNGIILSAGLRWTLGKEKNKSAESSTSSKKIIKQLSLSK